MNWRLSHHADPIACRLADDHYSRRTVGAPQMMPPGRKLVLLCKDNDAVFGVSWPYAELVQHDFPGAQCCTIFRRESTCPNLASDLIREAVAVARWKWLETPGAGMITFVNADKVRSGNPGYCFKKAGFRTVGRTRGGLIVLQLLPADFPDPEPPLGATLRMELAL